MMRIALPSSHSRIHKKIMNILNLQALNDSKRVVYKGRNAILLIFRPWDIPNLLKENRIDFGFSGFDTFVELDCDSLVIDQFDSDISRIAYCRTSGDEAETGDGFVVATEYPVIAGRYFAGRQMNIQILKIRGSAEAFPNLDGVSAIVDVVETGASTRINQLRVCDSIMTTYPCLAASKQARRNWPHIGFSDIKNLINECLTQGGDLHYE